MKWEKKYGDSPKDSHGPNRTMIHGYVGTTDLFVSCHELRGLDKEYLGPNTIELAEAQELAEKKIFKEMQRLAKGFGWKLVDPKKEK